MAAERLHGDDTPVPVLALGVAAMLYGPGDDGVMAFTGFGIETLRELVEMHKAHPGRLKRPDSSQ